MAPVKRKVNANADSTGTTATKRQKRVVEPTASSSRPTRSSIAAAAAPRSTRSSVSGKIEPAKSTKNAAKAAVDYTTKKPATKTAANVKATEGRKKRGKSAKTAAKEEEVAVSRDPSAILVDVPIREKLAVDAGAEEEAEVNGEGPAFWLMKAEPESRIEKGKDVKFSIDDLKSAKEPEAWDGMYFAFRLC